MKIINTLFSHNVYSGIHALFQEVSRKLGMEYVACDDLAHPVIKVGRAAYITRFIYRQNGVPVQISKGDVFVTRTPFCTVEPISHRLAGSKFFIVEESAGESALKRAAYWFAGKTFLRKAPFISQLPRVDKFFKARGFRTFYMPPFMKPDFGTKPGKHILYVARLVPVKNPQFVIELARSMPEEKFVVVTPPPNPSDDEYKRRVRDQLARLKNVEILEKVPYGRLLELYKEAKVLLLPSSSDPIGYCIVEALSRGTPVLSTPYAGASDFLPLEWVLASLDKGNWQNKIRGISRGQESCRKTAKDAFLKNNLELGGKYFNRLVGEITGYIRS